jgi:hypothetical protein
VWRYCCLNLCLQSWYSSRVSTDRKESIDRPAGSAAAPSSVQDSNPDPGGNVFSETQLDIDINLEYT